MNVVRWVILAAIAATLVTVIALRLTAPPPMVPCAQWTPAHQWCQGPAGVTP